MRGTLEKKYKTMERKLEADENFARKEGEKHGKKINDGTKKTDANTGKEKIDDNKKQNQVENRIGKENAKRNKKTSDDWSNNGTSENENGHYEKKLMFIY